MAHLQDRVTPPSGPPIAYTQSGHGRDVVLLHGALLTRDDMVLALMPPLSERFRVTAFDRPGHGESGRLGPTGTPWRQAEILRTAARVLGLERPVVVGHSFGGACALAWGMQAQTETAGVVALAPIAFPELRLEHFVFGPRGSPFGGPLVNAAAGAAVDPLLLPALWEAMFKPQPMPDRFRQAFPFDEAGRRAQTEAEGEDALLLNPGLLLSALNYPACEVPVRILAGDEDLVVNPSLHGKLLASLLPAGRYQELPGLGHMLHHFAQPAILEAIGDLAGV